MSTRSGLAPAFVVAGVRRWRSGSDRGQVGALGVLTLGVVVCLGVSLVEYGWMPLAAYVVWLLVGLLVLRLRALRVHAAVCIGAGLVAVAVDGRWAASQLSGLVCLVVAAWLVLLHVGHQRSGLPAALGESVLGDLRDRLQAQGTVPPLPEGWHAESAMLAAEGGGYAGDFLVAELDDERQHLEMILVDVCGKGVAAGTQALSLAGALSGLLGALPPRDLMTAANAYLLRQREDESFATAVHVRIDLRSGAYGIVSAGHPPALRHSRDAGAWLVDNARGTALGIDPRPSLVTSTGTLAPGEGLMFYTDGVIESRDADLDAGLAWLREVAGREVAAGFAGLPRRVMREVRRGDDDRAVLVLSRDA